MSLAAVGADSIRPQVFAWPLGVWALMAVLAVSNGILREVVFVDRLGAYRAHVLSTLLLVAVILTVAALFFARTAVQYTQAELFLVGLGWVVLTVGFEFLVGWATGEPVATTLAQYDVFAGKIWILVPIALFLAPLVFGR
jgi:hypothetical protein